MSSAGIRGVAGRLSGFTVSVIIVTLLGIVAIPLLTDTVGEATWGTLVLIQTVAQFGGILVAFGWGAVGAASVASIAEERRPAFFRRSLQARAVLYTCVFPLIALLLIALTHGDIGISILGAAVYLLPYLGANWYFTGEGRPKRLLLFDTVPIVIGGVLGLVGVWFTHELWVYLVFQGLGYLAAVSISALVVHRSPQDADFEDRTPLKTLLATQRHAVSATLVTSLYITLPMLAVWIFLRPLQPMFALANQLFRYASIALLPIQQFFQSWVPANDGGRPRRMRIATVAAMGIGIIGGTLIAFLSPWASTLLSVGTISVPLSVSLPLGVAFVGIATAAVVGYASLVSLGRVRALAVSTMIGAVVGAPLIILFAILGSVPAVAWAVAISELCVGGYLLWVLRTALREHPVRPIDAAEENA
ncbi:lipopolysaccharide biosynthesis protein [Microbacterium sp. A82]|uniref:lipopolysaccharide biosynthesis protein n=1 Tax=Microbacterium sp. A82 TaxID=3450452 RepID=UPI003F2D2DB3